MDYDLVIIGAGWAGFNAALKAKQLGLKVALVEKNQIGGTCLNRGCIPTKTLIQSAKVYTLAKKASVFGVDTVEPHINFLKIHERKDNVVAQLRQGMQLMLKGVDFIHAPARILSSENIKIDDKILKTGFILIATGSGPQELTGLKFDNKKIISSGEILDLGELPKSLLIIGGGVIGCEFAGLFSALGVEVSIIEKMPQLLPGMDSEVAKKLEAVFKKKKIRISTNTDAQPLDFKDYDLVLLCVGRIPLINGLGLEEIGIKLEKGRIVTDEYLKTNIPNIYAAGDCTAKIMLAHYASYQGCLAAENIAGASPPKKILDSVVPSCIFTAPEIATVGLSEEDAKNKAADIKVDKFDFMGSGMARILDETEGFIKIISDSKTGVILGASIIGPRATELIGILTLALNSQFKTCQVRNTIFAHPTLSESIVETFK